MPDAIVHNDKPFDPERGAPVGVNISQLAELKVKNLKIIPRERR
jgi:hypothetical protein